MTTTAEGLLLDVLADHLASVMDGAEAGHCVRIDDVASDLAPSLADALASTTAGRRRPRSPGEAPVRDIEIPPQRAIETPQPQAAAVPLAGARGRRARGQLARQLVQTVAHARRVPRADLSLVGE